MTKCHLCQTTQATAIKLDTDSAYDENGNEIETQVALPICDECEDAYYDGTEDYPGTRPLEVAA